MFCVSCRETSNGGYGTAGDSLLAQALQDEAARALKDGGVQNPLAGVQFKEVIYLSSFLRQVHHSQSCCLDKSITLKADPDVCEPTKPWNHCAPSSKIQEKAAVVVIVSYKTKKVLFCNDEKYGIGSYHKETVGINFKQALWQRALPGCSQGACNVTRTQPDKRQSLLYGDAEWLHCILKKPKSC